MSGGAAVKAGGGVEGDHPVCTMLYRRSNAKAAINKKPKEDRGDAPRRPEGLGLDSPETAGPSSLPKRIQPQAGQ